MAQRRMLSKEITTSDLFVDMPASTRRSRKYRELQKALQCNTDATERNGDIDIDIKKDINIIS